MKNNNSHRVFAIAVIVFVMAAVLFCLAFVSLGQTSDRLVYAGDFDGDGTISKSDVAVLKAHLLKQQLLEDTSADVNGDGNITVTDLIQLQAMLNEQNDAIRDAEAAYAEYVGDKSDTEYIIYDADGKWVALHNGSAVGVYGSKEEALKAMVTNPTEELVDSGDGKLFVYSGQDPVRVFEYIGTTAGTYITVNMENAADTASRYFSIDKYQVPPGSKVRIQARIGVAAYCAWVDANGNRTKALQGPGGGSDWNTDRTLTVPANAVYLEVSYVTENGLWVEELDPNIQLIEYIGTTEKTYINESMENASPDGATPTYNIARYRVTPGCEVHIIARVGGSAYCAWVDAAGNRSKALQGNSNSGRNVNQILIVPVGAVYLDVSYSINQELYVGDPTPIYGMKIGLLGDSIAANGGFLSTLTGKLGLPSGKNVAIGGWFYSEDTGVNGEYPADATHGIYRQIANLTGDEGLIILWAGTNDFGHSHRIGSMFDGHGQPNTDVTTLYGGINRTITELRNKFGGDIPIIICTPLHRNMPDGGAEGYPYSSESANKLGNYLDAYIDAIVEVAEYYNLMVFDSDAKTNLNPNDEAINSQYFSDGLHPNVAGHTVIGAALAQFIEEKILIK